MRLNFFKNVQISGLNILIFDHGRNWIFMITPIPVFLKKMATIFSHAANFPIAFPNGALIRKSQTSDWFGQPFFKESPVGEADEFCWGFISSGATCPSVICVKSGIFAPLFNRHFAMGCNR